MNAGIRERVRRKGLGVSTGTVSGSEEEGEEKVALNERTDLGGAGKKRIVQEDGEGGGNVND